MPVLTMASGRVAGEVERGTVVFVSLGSSEFLLFDWIFCCVLCGCDSRISPLLLVSLSPLPCFSSSVYMDEWKWSEVG